MFGDGKQRKKYLLVSANRRSTPFITVLRKGAN